MVPSSPLSAKPFPDPGCGPFVGEGLRAELNREEVAIAFRCLRAQVCVIALTCLSIGFAASLFWTQLAKYEAALAACARV